MLEEHRKFALRSFSQHISALDARITAEVKGMSKEERDDYYEHMHDQYIEITDTFPRLQWYAQFLIVYSTFEDVLNQLCRIVQRRSGFSLSFKDLDGQGITRAANYLVKVAKVPSPFESKEWHHAVLLGEVRNAIAHRNGEIPNEPSNKKSLGVRLANVPHLTLTKYVEDDPVARILLSDEFLRDAIEQLRSVVLKICNFQLYKHAG